MKRSILLCALWFLGPPMVLMGSSPETTGRWNELSPVYQVLQAFGEPMPAHYLLERDEQMVKQGEEIVKKGMARGPKGTLSTVQSKFFVCTDCHNVGREDPDLRQSDPESRLEYVIQNRLRFLPGTTFYGIVNRTRWYNGDYLKKYGNSAAKANKNLVKAIQLCATQCAMGRKLEDWELQAVLAYFWSLELRLQDLNLSESDWKKLQRAFVNPERNQDLITWLKGFYLHASPATFSKPPTPFITPDTYAPHIENGKAIYVLSCMSCHQASRTTAFTLGNSAVTYRVLSDHTDFNANFSVFNAVRNGINASPGKGYMPFFSLQRMSDHQLRDLQAFLKYQTTHEPLPLEPLVDWIK